MDFVFTNCNSKQKLRKPCQLPYWSTLVACSEKDQSLNAFTNRYNQFYPIPVTCYLLWLNR